MSILTYARSFSEQSAAGMGSAGPSKISARSTASVSTVSPSFALGIPLYIVRRLRRENPRQRRRNTMKHIALALGIVLAAASATAADPGISDLDKAWTKAMLANDVAAVGALYAPDAVMYPPDAMEAKGREAIQKGYADLLGGMKVLE